MQNVQNKQSQQSAGSMLSKAKIIYTCPMHPEVQMDEPGKCPKCGMDLIEKK